MSWAEIKRAVNSTLGTSGFDPLDKIIKDGLNDNLYEIFSVFADTLDSAGNLLVVPKVDTIPDNKYSSTNYIRVIIPASVKTIGYNAFSGCEYLRSIEIPDSVISIGSGAFSSCSALRNVNIGTGLDIVSSSAFFNCLNISDVYIDEGVKSIDVQAFGQCSSLKNIVLPKSLENISDNAFSLCTDLENVYYRGTEEEWNDIYIGTGNSDLTDATIHYNS